MLRIGNRWPRYLGDQDYIGRVFCDPSHPLARDLMCYYLPTTSLVATNLAVPHPLGVNASGVGTLGNLTAGSKRSIGTRGGEECWEFNGTNTIYAADASIWKNVSDQFMLHARIWDEAATPSDGHILGKVVSSWVYNFTINNSAQQISFKLVTSSANKIVSYPASSVSGGLNFLHGKISSVFAGYDGSVQSVYVPGEGSKGSAQSGNIVSGSGSDIFAIGGRGKNSSYGSVPTALVVMASRAWTISEADWLHYEPYDMLVFDAPIIYSFPSNAAAPSGGGLFMTQRNLNGLGSGGPFFTNPLG